MALRGDPLDLPRPFGPYVLVRRLAVGGMAEVYVGKTRGIGGFEKLVAIKVIHPRFSEDEHFIQMLVEEAKISVLLTHVNIAQTFDLGCIDETYFIVMEYIEGVDAFRVLRRADDLGAAIPVEVAAFIAAEVCAGLDYAHRKRDADGRPLGIVHRDMSPQNVLLSYSGEVKVVDFGIAKAALRAGQTEAGVIKGKYYYMSPEQAWADPVDHRSDVFSTGIVLHELLTGQMVYQEDNLPLLLDAVRKAEVPRPETVRPGVPAELSDIVMRAVAKRPEERFASAHDMGQALTAFVYRAAPTFTASRVAGLMAELFEPELRAAGLARPAGAGAPAPAPEEPRGELAPMTRDDLPPQHLTRSVIFDPAQETSTASTGRKAPPAPEPVPTTAATGKPAADPSGVTQLRAPGARRGGGAEPPTDEERVEDNSRTLVHPRVALPAAGEGLWGEGEATTIDLPGTAAADPGGEGSVTGVAAGPAARGAGRVEIDATRPLRRDPRVAGPPGDPSQAPVRPPTAAPAAPRSEPVPGRDGARGPGPGRDAARPAPPVEVPRAATPHVRLALGGVRRRLEARLSGLPPPVARRVLLGGAALAAGLVALGLLGLLYWLGVGSGRVRLEVISVPAGATVHLDDAPVGVTPLRAQDALEPGRTYALKILLAGYEPWESTLSAHESTPKQIAVLTPLRARLRVETIPAGAEVWLGEEPVGHAPVDVGDLVVGRALVVRARLPGHEDAEQRLTVRAEELRPVVRLSLRRRE